MADGSRHSLFIAPETTYGVTPTNPTFTTVRNTGTTLGLAKTSNQSAEIRSDRQIAGFRHGTKQIGGDINIELSHGSFDGILEAVTMGAWASNVLKAGTTRRSFSALRKFDDLLPADEPFHLYSGVEFNTFSLTVNPDSITTGTFGVLGKDLSTNSTAPSGSTFPAVGTTEVMDSFSGAVTEGGATIGVITEITLNLENGLTPRYAVGSNLTLKPSSAKSNVTGQVTVFFENSTLLNKFIDETSSSLSFTLQDTNSKTITITLPNIKYTGGQPDVAGEGPVTLPMPFQALYDTTQQTNIKIQRSA